MFSPAQYQAAADLIGCEPEIIEAVARKETANRKASFTYKGRDIPQILYERHVFWDLLEQFGLNPRVLLADDPSLSAILAQSPYIRYGRFIQQYERRDKAIQIHREAAFAACSYTTFQIMGYHHSVCGYDSAEAFAEAAADPETHLAIFVKFIKAEKLENYLRARDFEGFARRYNGPHYYKRGYHIELSRIYQQILASKLPKHDSVLTAVVTSKTVQRGTAAVSAGAVPVVATSTGALVDNGGLSGVIEQVQAVITQGKAAADHVSQLQSELQRLHEALAWLPWAGAIWTLLMFLILALMVRRYLYDRGYLS